jgi:5-amino-6-(5-phosphoribosylamino)uracil reductase/diaminohydroxyphosphoribosylaminopyrimidine deaminase/5-amino-6-(5-phosphoribosylamino)uracil reductase
MFTVSGGTRRAGFSRACGSGVHASDQGLRYRSGRATLAAVARPIVTVHVAQSLDGRLSFAGAPASLSTAEGRRSAHAARAAHDAVLVGIETVRVDDPRLTVREVEGRDPARVILSSALDVPLSAKVLQAHGRVIVIGASGRASRDARKRLEDAGAEVLIAEPTDGPQAGMVSIPHALALLAECAVKTLLVEGGGRVLTSFFRARRVDRMEIELATCLLGAPGTPMLGALGVGAMEWAPRLANVSVERLGANVLLRGDVARKVFGEAE